MKRICLLVVLAACSSEVPKSFEMPPIPVEVASVQVQDVPLYFETIGIIKPSQMADVSSQVSGIITGVHFDEGAWIEKGSLLYTIDDTVYRIRVQEAEALLAQNTVHLRNEERKLERYKSLSKPDFVASVEWDELQTKIALHEAILRADEAKLSAARIDLERCHVVAPIGGRAGKMAVHIGNMASPEQFVRLSQMDPLHVDFALTPSERSRLSENSRIEVSVVGGNGPHLAAGRITFIDHHIDPKTGMIHVKGLLTEIQEPLWAEQSVRVRIHFGVKKGALMIPLKAIKTNQMGPYVFLVKEDRTVEICPVKLGAEDQGLVSVNLEGGQVVTEGHARLFPGAKVEASP